MKINSSDANNSNKILIILILIFFSFFLCSFGLRQRYGFILLGIITIIIGSYYCGKIINISHLKKIVVFLFASLIIIYLIPTARYDIDTFSFYTYVAICTLTILYSMTDYKEIIIAFKIIELFGIIIALYITFSEYSPIYILKSFIHFYRMEQLKWCSKTAKPVMELL